MNSLSNEHLRNTLLSILLILFAFPFYSLDFSIRKTFSSQNEQIVRKIELTTLFLLEMGFLLVSLQWHLSSEFELSIFVFKGNSFPFASELNRIFWAYAWAKKENKNEKTPERVPGKGHSAFISQQYQRNHVHWSHSGVWFPFPFILFFWLTIHVFFSASACSRYNNESTVEKVQTNNPFVTTAVNNELFRFTLTFSMIVSVTIVIKSQFCWLYIDVWFVNSLHFNALFHCDCILFRIFVFFAYSTLFSKIIFKERKRSNIHANKKIIMTA